MGIEQILTNVVEHVPDPFEGGDPSEVVFNSSI